MILIYSIVQGVAEIFRDIREMDSRYYLIAIVMAVIANAIALVVGG